MFIQTEDTPNPESMKFLPGRVISEKGSVEFLSRDEAAPSRLAQKILAIDGLKSVFFGYDFITATKESASGWDLLKPHVLATIMDHFTAGLPAMDMIAGTTPAQHADADPIVKQICDILETRVRPAVAMDGGDITFQRFEDGIVYLHLRGACAGCPSSSATLKSGIENLLRHYVPEVLEVRPVNE